MFPLIPTVLSGKFDSDTNEEKSEKKYLIGYFKKNLYICTLL